MQEMSMEVRSREEVVEVGTREVVVACQALLSIAPIRAGKNPDTVPDDHPGKYCRARGDQCYEIICIANRVCADEVDPGRNDLGVSWRFKSIG